MEVLVKLDWPNHDHAFKEVITTLDHYVEISISFCTICEEMAKQSGIPTKEHYKHPKGCKCYWCASCECETLRKREVS